MSFKKSLYLVAVSTVLLAMTDVVCADDIILDLTQLGSYGYIHEAEFVQFEPSSSTGTGTIDAFVRLQEDTDPPARERGYNSDDFPTKDEQMSAKTGGWTHSLQVSAAPVAVRPNGRSYREFFLDINQTPGQSLIDLVNVSLYIAPTATLTYAQFTDPAQATLVYEMNPTGEANKVLLNYSLNSGSGDGDMLLYIPTANFGPDDTQYLYFYSEFENTNDGFEEWAVSDVAYNPDVPEPATMAILAIGGMGLLIRRRRK